MTILTASSLHMRPDMWAFLLEYPNCHSHYGASLNRPILRWNLSHRNLFPLTASAVSSPIWQFSSNLLSVPLWFVLQSVRTKFQGLCQWLLHRLLDFQAWNVVVLLLTETWWFGKVVIFLRPSFQYYAPHTIIKRSNGRTRTQLLCVPALQRTSFFSVLRRNVVIVRRLWGWRR